MSTTISISLYLAFVVWRWHADRVAEGRRAEQDAEIMALKNRLSAIEDALRSSPFVTFGRI